jgi:hypothetical protein
LGRTRWWGDLERFLRKVLEYQRHAPIVPRISNANKRIALIIEADVDFWFALCYTRHSISGIHPNRSCLRTNPMFTAVGWPCLASGL